MFSVLIRIRAVYYHCWYEAKVTTRLRSLEAKKIEYTIKVNTFQGGFNRALMLFSGEEFDTCSSSKAGEVITCRQELDALEMELYSRRRINF